MQVLRWVLEGCAILIMLLAAFSAGSFMQQQKLQDEWEKVEAEWLELQREQALWHSRRLSESRSNERKNKWWRS